MSYSALHGDTQAARHTLGATALAIAVASIVTLAGAWGFEVFGGYVPCELCLQERIPYYLAIPLGFAAAMLAATSLRGAAVLLALVSAAFLYNTGLGVYHAGAEWHFWAGPAACSPVEQVGTGDLLAALKHNHPVRCDEAALRILGISLAGYNVLISAALAALGLLALGHSRFWRSVAR